MRFVPVFDRTDFDKVDKNLLNYYREILDWDPVFNYIDEDIEDKQEIDMFIKFQEYAKIQMGENYHRRVILDLSE